MDSGLYPNEVEGGRSGDGARANYRHTGLDPVSN